MINQQILFGVVLSSIAISGILLFSKEMLYILYDKEFEVASSILRWQILGVFLRTIAFPFSYTILAKGNAKFYAFAQIVFWVGDFLLLMLCSRIWGFDGLGVNYPIAYLGYLTLTCLAARRICRFSFSKELIRVLAILCGFIGAAWIFSYFNIGNLWLKYGISLLLLLLHFCFVKNYLKTKMDLDIWQLIKNRIGKK